LGKRQAATSRKREKPDEPEKVISIERVYASLEDDASRVAARAPEAHVDEERGEDERDFPRFDEPSESPAPEPPEKTGPEQRAIS